MKWVTSLSLIAIFIVLLIAGWLLYIAFQTWARNQACPVKQPENDQAASSPASIELQDVIDEYSRRKGGVGLQVTVIFPGGKPWSGVAGYADIGRQCPLTLRHHLYIGSMTKLFTSALVMEQVESGSLSLQDTLASRLPPFPDHGITVRHLLTHASGLPDYARDPWFQIRWFGIPTRTWQPEELARVLRGKPLRFAPGSRHEYSNSNFLLLGMILEKVTGRPYLALLDTGIRSPLDLDDTYFLDYPADLAIANGYDESLLHLGRRNVTAFRRSLESVAHAAGGILSTSQDMARFAHSLFNGRLLSDASLAQMESFLPAPDEDLPDQDGYGLGLRHLVIDEESLIGHTGSIPGYSGITMHHPEKDFTIAILSNLSTIEQTGLLAEIQRIVIKYGSPNGGQG